MKKFKIKDDVDLKELEKYGFKKLKDFYIREYEGPKNNFLKKCYIRVRNNPILVYYKEIQDCAEDRFDSLSAIYQNYENIGVEDKIADLICAGLVDIEIDDEGEC